MVLQIAAHKFSTEQNSEGIAAHVHSPAGNCYQNYYIIRSVSEFKTLMTATVHQKFAMCRTLPVFHMRIKTTTNQANRRVLSLAKMTFIAQSHQEHSDRPEATCRRDRFKI